MKDSLDLFPIAKEQLIQALDLQRPSFSVMLTGSSIYTPNDTLDIDGVIIINDSDEISEAHAEAQQLIDGLCVAPEHLDLFDSGEIQIISFKGFINDTPVSFRVIRESTLRHGFSPLHRHRGIKALHKKNQKNCKIFTEIAVGTQDHYHHPTDIDKDSNNGFVIVNKRFTRKNTDGKVSVSSTGNRFLTGQIVYTPAESTVNPIKHHQKIWRNFIRMAIKQNPEGSPEDYLNSIFRSERFSEEFKQRALACINREIDMAQSMPTKNSTN